MAAVSVFYIFFLAVFCGKLSYQAYDWKDSTPDTFFFSFFFLMVCRVCSTNQLLCVHVVRWDLKENEVNRISRCFFPPAAPFASRVGAMGACTNSGWATEPRRELPVRALELLSDDASTSPVADVLKIGKPSRYAPSTAAHVFRYGYKLSFHGSPWEVHRLPWKGDTTTMEAAHLP